MEKVGSLKHAYNLLNESAMATALRNYNADVYSLLLQKNLQFCENCVQLMKDLPDSIKQISDKNEDFSKPLTSAPKRHWLLSKCFLATGHYNQDVYADKLSKISWELQEQPKISHLFRIVEKCVDLKIVFDFNHHSTGLMYPKWAIAFSAVGLCCPCGTLYIAGKRSDRDIKETLSHEIAHLM